MTVPYAPKHFPAQRPPYYSNLALRPPWKLRWCNVMEAAEKKPGKLTESADGKQSGV